MKRRKKEKYMATQLQKYSGKNISNNEVTVDFTTKEVKFKPLQNGKKKRSKFGEILNSGGVLYTYLLAIQTYIGLFIIPTMILLDYIDGWTHRIQFMYAFTVYLVGTLALVNTYPLLVFIPRFRDRCYPKAMAHMMMVIRYFKNKTMTDKYIFSHIDCSNQIEIDFDNVYLEYKVTGDLSDALQRIEVRSISTYDTGIWKARFIFGRSAVDGDLEIRAI